jgi:3-deoxy-D-manno-octulosonic-acid transferase
MFFIYQFLLSIIIIISPLIVIIRIFKNKEDKIRFKEKFCFFSKKRGHGKLVWFHGASVGEIMSVLPIINEFEKNRSINKILITTSTLSASKIIEKIRFKKVVHQFFPIDHIFFSKKFINFWKPNLAIFIESEIWPSMFKNLKKKNIPLILLNARITSKSFNRWSKIKKFSESIFNLISVAYPQNNETKFFLKKFNVKNIKLIGNLKFIQNKKLSKNSNKKEKNLFKQFKKYKTLVAASTHPTEEILAAKTHLLLKKKNKNFITIIIPRHVHRTNEIISELKKLKLEIVVHSSKNKNLNNKDIYIVDTFGESKKFYKIASTVFVGGSMINRGGQNPLEPARYGTKILHGPNVGNFKEIYDYLKFLKISSKVKTPHEISNSFKLKKNMSNVKKIDIIGNNILKKTLKELNKSI